MAIRDLTYAGEGLIPAPLHGPALRYTPLPKGAVTDIAVHHWTGFLPPETWTAGEEIAYILRIDEYHRTGRGLDGIGYHVCPFPSGNIYIVSRLDRFGAGVGYENNHLLHLALPGSFRAQLPSPQHLTASVEGTRRLYDYLGRDVPTTPHFNWGSTCPGERWPEWVPQLRAAATEEEEMNEAEVRAIARDEMMKVEFAAYDGPTPKSGKRTLATWAWSLIRHEQSPHGSGGAHDHPLTGRTGKT